MRYIDFLIEIGPGSSLKSHFQGKTCEAALIIDNELQKDIDHFLNVDRPWEKPQVSNTGEKLRKALFSGDIANQFEEATQHISDDKGLRIMLSTDPAYAYYPWEAMSKDGTPMSIDKRTPLVRVFKGRNEVVNLEDQPLRILIVASNAVNLPHVNSEDEINIIEDELKNAKEPVEIDTEVIATKQNIENKIKRKTYHIIHFIGHGDFNPEDNKGYLALRDPKGKKYEADENEIKSMFLNEKTVGLMVLNACQTAEISKRFTGLVPKLIASVPAIISMRTKISFTAAGAFARGLYLNLLGKTIEETIQETRQSMFNNDECEPRDFSIPVLYLGIDDENRTVGSRYGALFRKSIVSAPSDTSQATSFVEQKPEVKVLKDFYKIVESMHILQRGVDSCVQKKEKIDDTLQLLATTNALISSRFKEEFIGMKEQIEGKFPKIYKEIADYDKVLEKNIDQLQTCFSSISQGITTIDQTMKIIQSNIKNLYMTTVSNILQESKS